MTYSIRPFAPWDDLAKLNEISKIGWLSGHRELFSKAEVDQVVAAPNDEILQHSWTVPQTGITIVAVSGSNYIGAATLRPYPGDHLFGIIEPMNVLPEYQRQGVGSALWQAVVKISRARSDLGLDVWAVRRNTKAMAFYVKMGCRQVATGELRLGAHVEPVTGFRLEYESSST